MDRWNTGILVMMLVAALAATGLVLVQHKAFTQAKRFSDAQADLIDAKDRNAAVDSQNKELQIGEAKKVAGRATLEAGKANERAAELEKENLTLQQKLANRRITKEQHDILVAFLSKRPGRIIIETMGDSESGLFAADILKTFEDSGWAIDGKHFPLGVVWIGLILYDTTDPDALIIADALRAAGIPFKVGTEKREKATMMVGGKAPIF